MGTEVGRAPAWRRAARLFTAPAREAGIAALRWDLGFYLACLAFALPTALVAEFYGYRVWGNFATAAYGFGVLHSAWLLLSARKGVAPRGLLGSRWCTIAVIALLAMILPLALLVIRRLTGVDWLITPFSWAAQPEVWVIERSADLLLHHGTPYVDVTALGRAPEVNDYTPYGPVMAVFGLPRALFGGTPLTDALTDARWMFALAACACVLGTLKLLKWPKVPVGAAQLALACPLTALTWAVAGPDLAIVGLLVLACALAATGRAAWSGFVLALVVSAKLIVAPAAAVLAVFVLVRRGRGLDWTALTRFASALVATTAAVHLPVYFVDPAAFVEHVFRFPLGMGVVRSPAASPLPGHLIAELGVVGRVAAFALVGAAAVAMLVWLVRRPPANGSGAVLRIAVGLGALILLTPATRYGYLVYPLVLLGAHLAFRVAEASTARPPRSSVRTTSS
ncbi:glycosyltransferase 87 family protein [Amycolatopsis sp. OK19-0408]|uniref:Glycosyltransferase 87 family protein n=1 Tax=Amycolatopsis iheyensis TaxID=2945988 RepID=A0A9X2N974_9PSEU|nr:glycosyltransferase 87 family protein [Amycolatopsis iheyensis]MCR6482750.1 glycosyltransferase 87 family protein [Amycolatopsis iheyensis]